MRSCPRKPCLYNDDSIESLKRIDFKGGVPIVTPEEGDSESPGEI